MLTFNILLHHHHNCQHYYYNYNWRYCYYYYYSYLPVRIRVGSPWSSVSSSTKALPFGCGGGQVALFRPSCKQNSLYLCENKFLRQHTTSHGKVHSEWQGAWERKERHKQMLKQSIYYKVAQRSVHPTSHPSHSPLLFSSFLYAYHHPFYQVPPSLSSPKIMIYFLFVVTQKKLTSFFFYLLSSFVWVKTLSVVYVQHTRGNLWCNR